MKKIFLILAIIIASVYFGLRYFDKEKDSDDGIPSYIGYRVRRADLDNYIESEASIEAKSIRKIFVDKSLKVNELFFDEGDYVKAGDLIMTFDDEERNKILRSIERESIELERLNRQLNNAKVLYNLGGGTRNSIEDIRWDIRRRELNLEEYREELDKTIQEIRSPFEGTIISMVAEENYRVETRTELFQIADLSELIIKASVPEYDIRNVKIGQEVRIKPEVFDRQKVITGRVSGIANLSNSASTGEAGVEVEIEILDKVEGLLPGFSADVEIVYLSKENTIFVPRTAVISRESINYVYLVENQDTARLQKVSLGINNKETIEILEGLNGDESIISNPDRNLEDGSKVKMTTGSLRANGQTTRAPSGNFGGGQGR